MNQMEFDKGVKRVEALFGQHQNVYDKPVLTEIFDVVRHLDAEQWHGVVGAVVRTWGYKTLPSISAFEKQKNELGQSGRRTRKILQDCPTCGGGFGLRAFVYRYKDRFVEGYCICDCPNGMNFTSPPHMTSAQARRLPGFKAASRPGEVSHLLEALNPARQMPEKPARKTGEKRGIGSPEAKNVQDGRHATRTGKTSQEPQETAASGDGSASSPESKVGQGSRTLPEVAAQLAGKLDASQNPRQGTPEGRQEKRATDMVEELNTWLSDNEKAHTPF